MTSLVDKIVHHDAEVVVMGIGYVGLPLALEFARAGFHVTGYDPSREKVAEITAGRSYVKDVPAAALAPFVKEGRLTATTDAACLAQADAVIVCVPTPLNKTKDPDVSHILAATDAIAAHLHAGMVVVLESTTYPGTTREIVAPKLTTGGLELGKDVFLAFSPERVDPGNAQWATKNTPKVIGGTTPECLRVAKLLYQQAIDRLVPVSSTDAAEMVKLLENTFRAVNIGLVNEVALMCEKLGLDTWEVIEAAGTKPFGFMPFYPGPGLGGHCIPIDPLYLSWKLRSLKYTARFVELADEINRGMPEVVARLVAEALNGQKKAVNGARVLVLGVAYKRDVDDVRESPAIDVMTLLLARGAVVEYHDPHVPRVSEHGLEMASTPEPDYGAYDCVVIVTDHRALDIERVVREAKLVVDTRNATRGLESRARGPIHKL